MHSTLADLLPILKAEAELRRLDMAERIAVLAAESKSHAIQEACRMQFLELFGLPPELRHEYRSRLEAIRTGSRETVERIRRVIMRGQTLSLPCS